MNSKKYLAMMLLVLSYSATKALDYEYEADYALEQGDNGDQEGFIDDYDSDGDYDYESDESDYE